MRFCPHDRFRCARQWRRADRCACLRSDHHAPNEPRRDDASRHGNGHAVRVDDAHRDDAG
ncbi:hypothetical protein ACFPRL_12510 [Pseudoclavibacter helvolus]